MKSNITLNLTGEAIAAEASEVLEEEAGRVRQVLISSLLPQSIGAIWAQSPKLENLRRKNGPVIDPNLALALSHNVITFPGSTGLSRVNKDLVSAGVDTVLANVATAELGNLTRYPLSILNLSRHLRTASNFASKVLSLEQDEFVLLQDKKLAKTSDLLSGRVVKNIEELSKWLVDLESLMREYIDFEKNRKNLHRKQASLNLRENATGNLASTYTRRFARYIAISQDIGEIPGYFDKQTDTSLLQELTKLQSTYKGNEVELYTVLQNRFEAKASRIKSPRKISLAENHKDSLDVTHHAITLDDRILRIYITGEVKKNSVFEDFCKQLKVQFEFGSLGEELNSKLEMGSNGIEITLQKPKKDDLKKLIRILEVVI